MSDKCHKWGVWSSDHKFFWPGWYLRSRHKTKQAAINAAHPGDQIRPINNPPPVR